MLTGHQLTEMIVFKHKYNVVYGGLGRGEEGQWGLQSEWRTHKTGM